MNWKTLALALAALLYSGLATARNPALSPCHLPHLPERVQCGAIEVPEDRSRPAGRRIAIHFALVPATARPAEADPLLVLAGGPGQAAMEYGALLSGTLREVRKRRDVLLIDQRGTGRSAPLTCAMPVDAIGDGDTAAVQSHLRRCLSRLDADPHLYHTGAALADFEAVRRELGYRQVNLWGGSYGTRTALLYARQYPGSVRSMVLDSVAPPNARVLLSSAHSQAALERLLADCAADPACAAAFPHLRRDLATLLALPAVGRHAGTAIPQLLRGALYVPSHASVLPYAIHAAANGQFRPLQGLYDATANWSLESMTFGQTLSALCTDDAPFIDAAALARDAAGSVFGDAYARSWREWCSAWPAATPPGELAQPVVSAVPALLFAGGLDPVTPPAHAQLAARTLRHSRVLVAPQAGHTFSGTGCAPQLIAAFLKHADPVAVDGACLAAIRRPPFVLAYGQPTL